MIPPIGCGVHRLSQPSLIVFRRRPRNQAETGSRYPASYSAWPSSCQIGQAGNADTRGSRPAISASMTSGATKASDLRDICLPFSTTPTRCLSSSCTMVARFLEPRGHPLGVAGFSRLKLGVRRRTATPDHVVTVFRHLLLRNLVEGLVRALQEGLTASELLPVADGPSDPHRRDQAQPPAPGAFGSEQRVPLPPKRSSTSSPRSLQSRIRSAVRETGLMVGCMANPAWRQALRRLDNPARWCGSGLRGPDQSY